MKPTLCLLGSLLLLSTPALAQSAFDTPKPIIIAGQVENCPPESRMTYSVFTLLDEETPEQDIPIDPDGKFSFRFEAYTPTEIWFSYNDTLSYVMSVHPGDKTSIRFDGSVARADFASSFRFRGDGARLNRELNVFRTRYTTKEPAYFQLMSGALEMTPEAFLNRIDSARIPSDKNLERFIREIKPCDETIEYLKIESLYAYHDLRFMYAFQQPFAQTLHPIPAGYHDPQTELVPIRPSSLIAMRNVTSLLNMYALGYLNDLIESDEALKPYLIPGGWSGPADLIDSIALHTIINSTPDPLTRQLLLARYFNDNLDANDLYTIERQMPLLEQQIDIPAIREPLLDKYRQEKAKFENPRAVSDAILQKAAAGSFGAVFDSILRENRGKVIYIDVWAVGCGPCRQAMPATRQLAQELEDQGVVGIFLCIESEPDAWQKVISELGIGGQHYLLDIQQSHELRQAFDIQSIPHYILIDREGTIRDQGGHLHPGRDARSQITELL